MVVCVCARLFIHAMQRALHQKHCTALQTFTRTLNVVRLSSLEHLGRGCVCVRVCAFTIIKRVHTHCCLHIHVKQLTFVLSAREPTHRARSQKPVSHAQPAPLFIALCIEHRLLCHAVRIKHCDARTKIFAYQNHSDSVWFVKTTRIFPPATRIIISFHNRPLGLS